MITLSARIFQKRAGFARLGFQSSWQRSIVGNQCRFYPASGAGASRGKNIYGDDIDVPDVASETVSVVENIPDVVQDATFQSLGLGGFSSIGFVQNSLEFLHVSADLPWWGAITTVTVVARICLFPFVVKSRLALNNFRITQSEVVKNLSSMMKAVKEKDEILVSKLARENDELFKKSSLRKIIFPLLVQSCTFLSMALAIRRISVQPINSLMTGGLGWFSNLASPDPFYILPLITSLSIPMILYAAKDPTVPLPRPVLLLFYTMCPIVFVCLSKYEAGLTFYLCINSLITTGQSILLNQPAVKSYFNLDFKTSPVQKPADMNFRLLWQILQELNDREKLDELVKNKRKKDDQNRGDKQSFEEERTKRKRP